MGVNSQSWRYWLIMEILTIRGVIADANIRVDGLTPMLVARAKSRVLIAEVG